MKSIAALWVIAILGLGIGLYGLVGGNSPTAGAITSTTKAIIKAAGFITSGTVSFTGAFTSSGATSVGTFTQGGGVTATSSAVSATLLASDFDVENGIEVSLPVGSVTLTLPASTTFPIGTTAGSMRNFTIFNASTTAGQIITIAGGTGTLLEIASSTVSTALKTIAPSGVAVFTAWRKANSDIEVFMDPGQ